MVANVSFQTKCRDTLCHKDRYLKGQFCLLDRHVVDDTCYKFYIKLTATSEPRPRNASDITDITSLLLNILSMEHAEVVAFQMYTRMQHNTSSLPPDLLVVEVVLEKNRSAVEDIHANLINQLHHSYIRTGDSVYATELAVYNTTNEINSNILVYREYNTPGELFGAATMLSATMLSNTDEDALQDDLCSKDNYVLFSKLHVCPYIQIDIKDIAVNIINGFLVLEEEYNSKVLSPWEFNRQGDTLSICLRDYQSMYGALPLKLSPLDNTIHTKDIVAFICTCVSLASLVVTIMVYLVFKDLQSQPGINNIILCVFLLIAQSTYQFGTGQTSLSYWACSVIGALSHFFWLCVMFAMSACSIQMFLVFKRGITRVPRHQWKHTLKHILYITLSSSTFVMINIVVSMVGSNGKRSGYGGNICYLSTYRMHLITFIIPTVATVSTNIAMFLYVVCKLQKASVASQKMNVERDYFKVYARLSTLTGITWTIGFILFFVNSDVIEYLFIIFNAGQGVFIMAAFVLNKRILSRCVKRKETTVTRQMSINP